MIVLRRALVAEALGTAALVCVVVGSGIMGERLAGGNAAIALLANSLATGFALYVLISILAPVSGAHFNPVVTLVEALRASMSLRVAGAYVIAQIAGAALGTLGAHAMFELPLVQAGTHVREGGALMFSEVVATAGLMVTIAGFAGQGRGAIAAGIGAYIAAAYWFTSSTSFANPAVTLARALTDTFSGIRPADVPAFILAQIAGGLAGHALSRHLFGGTDRGAAS